MHALLGHYPIDQAFWAPIAKIVEKNKQKKYIKMIHSLKPLSFLVNGRKHVLTAAPGKKHNGPRFSRGAFEGTGNGQNCLVKTWAFQNLRQDYPEPEWSPKKAQPGDPTWAEGTQVRAESSRPTVWPWGTSSWPAPSAHTPTPTSAHFTRS